MMFVSMVHICTVIELQITSLIFWPSSTAGIFCKNCHEEATSHLSTIALQVSSKKHTTCIQLISESIQRILQCFVFLQEWCPILKGRKMNCCCLRMCYTIMRLLLNVSHLILQRSTITARFIGFNLPCFAPNIIYTLYKHCRFQPQFTVNAAASLFLPWWHLFSLTATCMYVYWRASEKDGIYKPPLTRMNICNKDHMITCPIILVHVQSSNHLFISGIYGIILQRSLLLYNNCK